VEDYLEQLVEKELPLKLEDATRSEGSGMVWENGLFVYRTGRPLPLRVVDDAIRQVREERAQHILVHCTDRLLLRLALARLTFSRMSLAFAVQIKGLGWRLCSWI
jgi:hypothetical protein